ncbi:Rne/Rng family ribonuclease [Heyndrickxia acidiproducens]|uniref:Rne/Rng family ribonuclease n=1 Tax=Heyndrickxia acidiproducens TaxID=1121084 RepID=UPI00037A31F4|nr:Rne/Rng family ribonuclease [Heyndrickxia acidiproducens]
MSQSLIINFKSREKRYAIVENGEVSMIKIQQPAGTSKVGNIYLGKVAAIKPGINAAFIDIGEGRHGYLHRDQLPAFLQQDGPEKEHVLISNYLTVGQKIMVQVKKDETALKGPLLTGIIELPGERIIYLPEGRYAAVSKKADENKRRAWRNLARGQLHPPEGIIIRTAAFQTHGSEWLQELDRLRKRYHVLASQARAKKAPAVLYEKSIVETEIYRELVRLKSGTVVSDDSETLRQLKSMAQTDPELDWSFQYYNQRTAIFTYYHVENALENALKRVVWLENGSYLVIDETEALISIDVNTGKFTGQLNQHDTVLKTNLLAAKEIGRQIMLRDYGGIILVDFIDMQNEQERGRVKHTLQEALEHDPKQTRIVGFTALGILQITRKKTRKTLSETLLSPCPVCNGTGRIESPETLAFRLERELWEAPFGEHEAVMIACSENVRDCFCGENDRHLKRLESMLHVKLFFQTGHNPHPYYSIRQFGTVEELAAKENNFH